MASKSTSIRESKANTVIKTFLWLIAGIILQSSLNYLGLAVGLLWIWKKVQQNKLPRLIAFIIGFCIALLGSPILEKQADQYLNTNYPELVVVTEKLSSSYPDAIIGVSSQQKENDNQNGQENNVVISVRASKVDDQNIPYVAQVACDVLQTSSKSYTHVIIKKVSGITLPFINLTSSFDMKGTCSEWLSKK